MQKHLQRLLLIVVMMAVPWVSQGQSLSDYSFTVDTTTFQSIRTTGTALSFSTTDDGYATTTLPFALGFGESSFAAGTTIACSANGFIRLGASSTSGTTASYSSSSDYLITAILQQDAHIGRYSESGAYYLYNADSGTFTIEYHLLGTYTTPYGAYSYQVVFHTNNTIEIIYDSADLGGASSRTMATYLVNGPNNDRLFVTGPWATPSIAYSYSTRPSSPLPAHGLRYTFRRPSVTCPKPVSINVTELSDNSISFTWTDTTTSSMWMVRYTDTTNTIINDVVYDTSYTIADLASNTEYTIYVASICGSGDTSSLRAYTFRTPCSALDSLPWSMNFESEASGSTSSTTFVNCMSRLNDSPQYLYPYVYNSSSYAHSGSKSIYWYHTNSSSSYYSSYECFVLPGINNDVYSMNNMEMSFWAKSSSTSYYPIIHVGVLTNPNDITTFVPVDTIHISNSTMYEKYWVDFSNYTGNGQYIAFYAPAGGSNWYAYLDDIMMRSKSECPYPTNLTAIETIIPDSVTIAWSIVDTNSMVSTYDIAVGVHGFNPDTASGDNLITQWSDTAYIFTNLVNGTTYDVYVRSECSEYSYWTDPVTFTVGGYCMPRIGANSLVLSTCEGIIYDDGGPTDSYGTNCNSILYLYPQDSTKALVLSGTSHTYSSYSYLRVYEGLGTAGRLIFDDYNISATRNFSYVTGGGPVTIVFRSDASSTRYDGFSIHATCVDRPNCERPENFTMTSLLPDTVAFSWVDTNGSQWSIIYGPHGFDYFSTDDSVSQSESFSSTEGAVGSLNPNTEYDFYLVTDCGGEVSLPQYFRATTPCTMIPDSSLPFHYGFEDATSGTSGNLNPCWRKGNEGVSTYYPYVSTSYHAEGSKSLYFYGYSGTYYCYAVMPLFESPIRDLMITLKLYKTSSSYGSIEVGIMTDPEDISTFTSLNTFQPEQLSTWEEFTTTFRNYNGNGRFIAFLQRSTYYTYLDDITIDFAPTCPPAYNVNVNQVSTSSAFVTWGVRSGYADVPDNYEVTYINDAGVRVSDTTSNLYYMLTGLQVNSPYRVVVTPICGNTNAGGDSTTFSTLPYPCLVSDTVVRDTIVFSTGTNQVSGANVYSGWGNSLCQTIYTVQELTAAGLSGGYIRGIRLGYTTNSSYAKELSIYLTSSTSASTYLSTDDMVPLHDSMLVYGPAAHPLNTSGWQYYDFGENAFFWDGISNLVLTTFMNQPTGSSHTASSFYGYSTDAGVTRTMYRYKDSNPWTVSSSNSGSGGTLTARPSITFITDGGCLEAASCANPMVRVLNVSDTSVDLIWGAGGSETAWDVAHREEGSSTWITDLYNTTNNSYTFTGLTPNSAYEFRISHLCDSTTFSNTVSINTPCSPISVPLHEGFATWSTSTVPAPSCWYKLSTYSSNYPYVSTSYSSDGDNRSMYFYTSSGYYSALILPRFDVPIDTLVLTFSLMSVTTSYTHTLQVGVMTDPEDISTFQLAGTASPSTDLYEFNYHEITFRGMPDGYIAIRTAPGPVAYPYLDELEVNYYNPCVRPSGVTTTSATLTSANLRWNDDATNTFEYEYGPYGFTRGTGITGTVTGNSISITGLVQGTNYDFYVRGICSSDTGNWSFRHTFSTACGKIDSLPFFEDFNSWGTGTSVHAPNCWIAGSDYSSTYPYINNSYNHSGTTGGSMYMYNYVGSNPNSFTYLTLPELDTSVANARDLQVVFYGRGGTSSYVHQVVIGVCDIPGATSSFTPIDTVTVPYFSSATDWEIFEVPLNAYTGNGRYITLNATSNSSSYSYPYLDDLTIERIPTCQRPNQLTANNPTTNSIELGWNSRSESTEFVIEYGPLGFTPGTGTAMVVTTNPYTLTGLPANYQGEFYVRNICGAGDTSDYSRSACPFTLIQTPATLPYSCTFEDMTEARSWHVNSNSPINWAVGSAMVDSGSYSLYISPDHGATYGNANFSSIVNATAFRDIDFGPIDSSYTITFRAKAGGTISNTYDGLMVFLVDTTNPVTASSTSITTPWGNVNDLYTITFVRLDTAWRTYQASLDTIHGVHRVAFFWFNQNTGASYPYIAGPAAVDNIHIDYSACTRPLNLTVDDSSITSNSAYLSWDGSPYMSYRVAYRVAGAPASTNTYIDVINNNHVTLTGLSSITVYRAWVQKLCGSDTSLFSDGVEFMTNLCENAIETSIGSSSSSGTSNSAPVNNYWRFSLTETIIDSAELNGPVDIEYLAYYYDYTTASSVKTNCTVYFQPTTKTSFANEYDVVALDTSIAVRVYTGPLNCSEGWNFFPLENVYSYDGNGNIMIIVDDNSNAYDGSAYVFKTESCTDNKTLYYYSDSEDPDVMNPASYGGNKYTASWRAVTRLISCGLHCSQPIITGITHNYNSATLLWTGDGIDYEVNIKEATASNWPATDIAVSGNTYTFNGLMPSTNYTIRVRQNCSADSIGYSDWVEEVFTTDSLPCFAPDSLHVTAVTNATATFDWNVIGNETDWDIHVWFTGGFDSIYRVNTHPATVGGFVAGLSYNASIRALCGTNLLEGNWGDTITFSTATCPDVTGLTSSNVTTNSVTLNWNNDPMAESWIIEYGYEGFNQGTGITATATTNSYIVTGLTDDSDYEFYVKAVCGTDWNSENWVSTTATTLASTVPCDEPYGVTTAVADNSVTVNWTANTGNISFEIEYGTHGFNHGAGIVTNATSSPAVISNLEYETDYDIYVRAVCDQNTYSDWSTVATFTTGQRPSEDCNPVTNLAVSNITDNAAVVTWTPGDPDDNNWQVVLTDDRGNDILDTYSQEARFALNDLTPGTNYVVKVRTVCDDNNFSAYASVNFRTTGGEGIDNVSGASCTIYPNPTNSSTTVSVSGVNGKVKIEVVDMNGRTVASETLECNSECVKTMDVNNLAQGAYFVRITGDNTNMVKKLVVR